jgi:hypothetical protein
VSWAACLPAEWAVHVLLQAEGGAAGPRLPLIQHEPRLDLQTAQCAFLQRFLTGAEKPPDSSRPGKCVAAHQFRQVASIMQELLV